MRRFPVTWGNPPGMGDHPDRWLCFACGHELPARAVVQCGECAHAWASRLGLWWHDTRSRVRVNRRKSWDPAPTPWFRATPWQSSWWNVARASAVLLFRPSKIWVCPCCSHDL